MKREIKFRVWHKDLHEMLYEFTLPLAHKGTNKAFESLLAPIMQFTGLLDKNGKDIFESDRVFDPFAPKDERELFTVKYDNGMARFILDGEGEAEWDETDWQIYDNIYEQKPVKEIYENTELLKP